MESKYVHLRNVLLFRDSSSESIRDGVESLRSSSESIYENGNQINEGT